MKPATLPADFTATFAERQYKALLVHDRLCAEYGAPFRFFSTKDPLSELISSLLSHRTKNADSHRAYQQLRAAFPTWAEVCAAPTAEVEAAISPATWPEQKAPRIQAILKAISERCGGPCDLEMLAAMPVDSHHPRVAQRLALIGPRVGEAAAHPQLAALLPPDWTAQQVYDHHEAFMFHGQKCCYFHTPACGRCVVLDQCPFGQERVKGKEK